ncbi:hypothetical protein [Thalassospira marina]|nr:hypothetical protein [Thalassospira marina]
MKGGRYQKDSKTGDVTRIEHMGKPVKSEKPKPVAKPAKDKE